jgi:hypothetical protein
MTDSDQPPSAAAPHDSAPLDGIPPVAPLDRVPAVTSEDIADIAAEQGYTEPDLFVGPEGGRRVLRFERFGAAQVIASDDKDVVDERTREQSGLFRSGALLETMPRAAAPSTPAGLARSAPAKRISRQPAAEPRLSNWYELGHATAQVYQRRSEWLSRRVETIEFAAGGEVLRRLSVDFEIPDGLPELDGLAAPGLQLVPVSSYRKWPPLSTFDFRSDDGQPLSLYRRITNNSLDFGLLIGMAELVSQPPPDELKAQLWGIVMADEPPNDEVVRTVKALAAHLKAHASAGAESEVPQVIDLAARLASSAILWAPVAGTPGTDRIIKFGYREEQEQIGGWWNSILVACSWRPRVTWIQLPQAGLHTRHHVEVRAPNARGLVFLNAVTAAFPAFPTMMLTEPTPVAQPLKAPGSLSPDSGPVRGWRRGGHNLRAEDAQSRGDGRLMTVRTTIERLTRIRFGTAVADGQSASPAAEEEQAEIEPKPAITTSVETTVVAVSDVELEQPPATAEVGKSSQGSTPAGAEPTLGSSVEEQDATIGVATQDASGQEPGPPRHADSAAASKPPRAMVRVQISNGDVFVYHPERVIPSHRMFMVLHTGASREGYVTTCALSVIVLNLLMTVTFFHLRAVLAHLDATIVLLAALPALLGFAVLRPTEHELERAQTVGVRIMTLLAGSLPVLAMTMAVATHDIHDDFPDPAMVRPVWAGLVVLGWAIAIAISWSWLLAANPKESGARDRRLVKLAPDSAIGSAAFAVAGGVVLPAIYALLSGDKLVSSYLLLAQTHTDQTLASHWLAVAAGSGCLFIALTALGPLIAGFWRLLHDAAPRDKRRRRVQIVVGTGLLFALTSGLPLLVLIWEALIGSSGQALPDLHAVARVLSDIAHYSAIFAAIWIAASSLWLAERGRDRRAPDDSSPDRHRRAASVDGGRLGAGQNHRDVESGLPGATGPEASPSVEQDRSVAHDTERATQSKQDADDKRPAAEASAAPPRRRLGSERFYLGLAGVVAAMLWLASLISPAVAPGLLPQWAALFAWLLIVWQSISQDCRNVSPL